MKIQEMKSGILHLNKKMENERRENVFEMQTTVCDIAEPDVDLSPTAGCELDQPRWSVVSFDQREAGGLSYGQASAFMSELDSHGVAGLCIVTDDAAARVSR